MKTFSKSIITPLVLAVILLAACKKNNSSNTATPPSGSSKLTFQLAAVNSADSTGAAVDSVPSIAGLVWSAGTANVGKFDFVAKRSGVSINILSRNLTNVDLFALTPLVTYVTLDTGVYKQIQISAFLESSNNDSIPPLKLSGSFTNDSSKVVPITFTLTDNAIVQVGASNIDINGTTDYTALLDMQLNKVTRGITAADLNKAKVTNGTIVISRSSNSQLYYKMRANIAGCGRSFFRFHHR
ncbi:MAG TPA: hypothetical protein VGM63_08385 [Mucilaginibacter sp.]